MTALPDKPERACEARRSEAFKPSADAVRPMQQNGSEDVATVEVTVVVEVIVDRGLGGGKLLEGFHVLELRHRTAQIDPKKMQENQWPRNPVPTFWYSKRICSDNARLCAAKS